MSDAAATDDNPFPAGTDLHEVTRRLLARTGVPPLVAAGRPVYDAELASLLTHLMRSGSPDVLLTYNTAAALHLLNDDLDAAHRLVQAHEEDGTANYLHQIVHRREGDWSNTRYWVARTGRHPFHEEMLGVAKASAAETGGGTLGQTLERWSRWEPGRMVELCEGAAANPGPMADQVARLSWAETRGLLGWCVRHGA
jgi:hypothetical protein